MGQRMESASEETGVTHGGQRKTPDCSANSCVGVVRNRHGIVSLYSTSRGSWMDRNGQRPSIAGVTRMGVSTIPMTPLEYMGLRVSLIGKSDEDLNSRFDIGLNGPLDGDLGTQATRKLVYELLPDGSDLRTLQLHERSNTESNWRPVSKLLLDAAEVHNFVGEMRTGDAGLRIAEETPEYIEGLLAVLGDTALLNSISSQREGELLAA
jgi:hypothetical protein